MRLYFLIYKVRPIHEQSVAHVRQSIKTRKMDEWVGEWKDLKLWTYPKEKYDLSSYIKEAASFRSLPPTAQKS